MYKIAKVTSRHASQYKTKNITYTKPPDVTSSVQKYRIVIAHRTSQSNVNSMLNCEEETGLSTDSFKHMESSGMRTNLKLSFLIFTKAFSVRLGSPADGAG